MVDHLIKRAGVSVRERSMTDNGEVALEHAAGGLITRHIVQEGVNGTGGSGG